MSGFNFMRESYPDDWNKANYGGNGYSDHVCRPVIIDAEGRKRPIIAYPPYQSSENYVTERRERIVEHVRAPVVVTEYKYTSQAQVEPLRDYVTNEKWPPSQVYDRPEYRYGFRHFNSIFVYAVYFYLIRFSYCKLVSKQDIVRVICLYFFHIGLVPQG